MSPFNQTSASSICQWNCLGLTGRNAGTSGNAGHVRHVDVGEAGRELGDVDAVNAQRISRMGTEVRLKRERHRLRVAASQLVHERGEITRGIVERRAMRRQARVLYAGHERTEIELGRRF